MKLSQFLHSQNSDVQYRISRVDYVVVCDGNKQALNRVPTCPVHPLSAALNPSLLSLPVGRACPVTLSSMKDCNDMFRKIHLDAPSKSALENAVIDGPILVLVVYLSYEHTSFVVVERYFNDGKFDHKIKPVPVSSDLVEDSFFSNHDFDCFTTVFKSDALAAEYLSKPDFFALAKQRAKNRLAKSYFRKAG